MNKFASRIQSSQREKMAGRIWRRSRSVSGSQTNLSRKIKEDNVNSKTAQNSVTCVYQAHIGGYWRNITVHWTKNMMNHCVAISVDSLHEDFQQCTCKIDLKPWHFWSKKGYKTFEVDGNQLEAYWDLRAPKFSGSSPEPISDFYVALVSEEEVVLFLGDNKQKVFKKAKARPALVDAVLFYKKEHVFSRKSFSTRAKFDHKRKEHDIIVESSTTGPMDPEMWISIDGVVMIHIQNLHWKFRGNQTVLVNKQSVQVFWDVYAWLFSPPGSSHGLFIFKPAVALDLESDAEESSKGGESEGSDETWYYSAQSHSKASPFCLFLYAWKHE